MKNCAYKSLLAEAFDKKPLLPVSPNAYLGTVLHKVLEQIAKGLIKNENELNNVFEEEITRIERTLEQSGYDFLVPLQKNARDFGMKKILLLRQLKSVTETNISAGNVEFHSEKWLESKDKLIAGKIDLIIETKYNVEIVDFKTGQITQDVLDDSGELFLDVKEEYKEQLKLYAQLYFEETGKFPNKISVVDLAKQKFDIDFSEEECSTIFHDAKELLREVNRSISSGIFTANPTEMNCKFCLYRPACSYFLNYIKTDFQFNDTSGFVKNIVKFQNGNVSIYLDNGINKITVTGFSSERYDELKTCTDKQISVFNLRRSATDFVYSASKTTMIYE